MNTKALTACGVSMYFFKKEMVLIVLRIFDYGCYYMAFRIMNVSISTCALDLKMNEYTKFGYLPEIKWDNNIF